MSILSVVVSSKTEKRLLKEMLIAYKSYLIGTERAKRDFKRTKKAESFLNMQFYFDGITYDKVQVRYNKYQIIKGKIVGFPKKDRERFCLQWKDNGKTRMKYFPYTSIVSYWASSEKKWIVLKAESTFECEPFDYSRYEDFPKLVSYLKYWIHSRSDIERALDELVHEIHVSDMPSKEEYEANEKLYDYERSLGKLHYRSRIRFLYNGKTEEGVSIHWGSESYLKIEAKVLKTKDHTKYIHKRYYLGVIEN
ncbi:MAG: hypothetical protein MJ057_01595 [Sphaerochaetaceae bacterium]|nr:hypothetical protein [Sphaerochaetaceae bacterium]